MRNDIKNGMCPDMFPFADILSRTGFNVFIGTTEWHVSTLYVCMYGWMDGWCFILYFVLA